MLDMKEILETLQEYQEDLDNLREDIDDARGYADEAETSVDEAKGYIENASTETYQAKDKAEDAQNRLSEFEKNLQELIDKIENSDEVPSGERNLQSDIRKYKASVIAHLQTGRSHSWIADNLKISEFLVQCIEDEMKRDKAA
jgi:chromosome segregation ATPase